jgi:ELWxxDGT repeat protein
MSDLTALNGELYFWSNGSDGGQPDGYQLWQTDGTNTGTQRVTDINSGTDPADSGFVYPENITVSGGKLYFYNSTTTSPDQLWISDGTASGTYSVSNIPVGYLSDLIDVNGELYFTPQSQSGLWKTDGTTAGTQLVTNANSIQNLTNVNGELYFTTGNGENGFSLWKTDGTTTGTVMIESFGPANTTFNLVNAGGTLYVVTDDLEDGGELPQDQFVQELFRSDGTAAGTQLLLDFNCELHANTLVELNGTLIFGGENEPSNPPQVWALPTTAPAISIAPQTLPDPAASPYSQQFSASGTTSATTFSLAWGFLPPGLALSTTGALTGTPTENGTYAFTVQATDGSGASADQPYLLTVNGVMPPPPPAPVPPPLPPVVATPLAVGAGAGQGGTVNVYDASGNLQFTLQPFGTGFTGGVSVAVGDVTGSGDDDIIVGAGTGGGPVVAVYDGLTGAQVNRFYAFDPSFRGGVSVAVGDVTGSGQDDIIVGAGAGGGPEVAVFNGVTGAVVNQFYAFDPSFLGGVNVAVGDVTGSGTHDIIVGAGAGGGPEVAMFDGVTGAAVGRFFAFDSSFRGGVNVAAADLNGPGPADVVTTPGVGGGPVVESFGVGPSGAATLNSQISTYAPSFRGGLTVGLGPTSNTLVVGPASGSGAIEEFAGPDLLPQTSLGSLPTPPGGVSLG